MNKQEALEALLTKMRGWEQPDKEARRESLGSVLAALDRNVARLGDLREAEEFGVQVNGPDVDAALISIGAAVLYLLVDEVTLVEGRSLEEWLAQPGNREGVAVVRRLGSALLAAGYSPGPASGEVVDPRPIVRPGPGGRMVRPKYLGPTAPVNPEVL